MKIQVLFFASCREKTGISKLELELMQMATTRTMMAVLLGKYPELEEITAALKIAVNKKYITEETALAEGDEVALLPPISGG